MYIKQYRYMCIYICAVYGIVIYSFLLYPLHSMIDVHNLYNAQFSK